MNHKFPDGFKWGSATSSHQIEGDNRNDWSQWERSPARLAHLAGEGKDPKDFVSGKACDSYHRYAEDLDIAKQLGHNIHRFSIEWSRIEPEEGKFDSVAMRHYIDVVKAIRERGMEPMVTLWHFTNPIWFSVKGGFLNPHSPELYKRFIRHVVDNLKGDVKLWITFNEATTVYGAAAYLKGYWPPQHKKDIWSWFKFRRNIAKAHTLAYREIKNQYRDWFAHASPPSPDQKKSGGAGPPPAPPGMSHNVEGPLIGSVESNWCPVAGGLAKLMGIEKLFDSFINHWLWRRTLPYQDFIGLNYYTVRRFPGSYRILPKQDHVPEMNWEIYPDGLYRVLMAVKKFNKPVFITENGMADATDQRRAKFIRDHLDRVWLAIRDGVDVRGYMYWSLLDNFEWAFGYAPRFGLVEIDYQTFKRTVRPSALEYAKIIAANGLEIGS